MPPRLPSSGMPASQEPRWGTANLSTSCECADVLAPATMATAQSAVLNIAIVLILPPATAPHVALRSEEPIGRGRSSDYGVNFPRRSLRPAGKHELQALQSRSVEPCSRAFGRGLAWHLRCKLPVCRATTHGLRVKSGWDLASVSGRRPDSNPAREGRRPKIDRGLRNLIRRMSRENSKWGHPGSAAATNEEIGYGCLQGEKLPGSKR